MGKQSPAATSGLSGSPIVGAHRLKMQLCWPVFLKPTSTPSTRAGRVEEASACADRLRKCIQRATGAQLRDLDPRGNPKDIWTRVNNITKGKSHAAPDNSRAILRKLRTFVDRRSV